MKHFRTHFNTFWNPESQLSSPKTKALFNKEVLQLFALFQKYLDEHYVKRKGLTLKGFKTLLRNRGYILITNKK
jgi:hypothetical protein